MLKSCHAYHVLTDLDYLEFKLFVFDGLDAELVTECFDFGLHGLYLGVLALGFSLELSLALLERIYLHKVVGHLLLQELSHLLVKSFFILEFPFEVLDCLPEQLKLFKSLRRDDSGLVLTVFELFKLG